MATLKPACPEKVGAHCRPPAAGIYQVRNAANGKLYIGSSTDMRARLRGHALALYGGRHYNRRLQRDFERYGWHRFEFEVLEVHDRLGLCDTEQDYIDHFKTENPRYGYNRRAA